MRVAFLEDMAGPVPLAVVVAPPAEPVFDAQTAALTQRMARGDEAAFHEFHDRYFDRLLRYQFVLARGDEDAAREALQETLTRVARRVRRFDDEHAFWCWLACLARSAAIDAARRRTRYSRLLRLFALGGSAGTEPREDAADARLEELLARSVESLDPDDRALLDAKYTARSSVRAIAEERRTSEKAIESRLLRIRRELRCAITTLLRHEND
jgi:RNA polymerase sigma factor (sigma-70 family)